MNEGLISGRYAKALFKHCVEKGIASQVYDQMNRLASAFEAEKALQIAVDNPYLHPADKERVLLTAAGAVQGDSVDKFVLLLIKNNRINLIRTMALSYGDIYRKVNSIARVVITTAVCIDAEELEKIKKIVAGNVDAESIEFKHIVNPDLIGGFTVNIDSKLLDASVRNELKKLRLKLLS